MPRLHLALFVFAAGMLCACASPTPQVASAVGNTSYPPTEYVAMLDTPPTRAYEQIGVIDVAGEPGSFRSQVLAQVSQRARQMGADAVILQDVSRAAPPGTKLNPTTGTYETTGGQMIPAFKGVAIKYRQ